MVCLSKIKTTLTNLLLWGCRCLWPGLLLVIGCCCQHHVQVTAKDLKGTWKTDTIWQYTNGFVEKRIVFEDPDNIVFAYDGEQRMWMKKNTEQRMAYYRIIQGDSLQYLVGPQQQLLSAYRILSYSPTKLVLRKNHVPIFSGKNQLSYEVRQFSLVSGRP